MVKLLNATNYQFRRHHQSPFKKSHTESLHCGRVSDAYECHSPLRIFASRTGLVSPECSGMAFHSCCRNWKSWPTLAGGGWLSEGGPKLLGTSTSHKSHAWRVLTCMQMLLQHRSGNDSDTNDPQC